MNFPLPMLACWEKFALLPGCGSKASVFRVPPALASELPVEIFNLFAERVLRDLDDANFAFGVVR